MVENMEKALDDALDGLAREVREASPLPGPDLTARVRCGAETFLQAVGILFACRCPLGDLATHKAAGQGRNKTDFRIRNQNVEKGKRTNHQKIRREMGGFARDGTERFVSGQSQHQSVIHHRTGDCQRGENE